jgi:hypothetical protein
MDKAKINHCIETFCYRGCREVTRIIGVLERGEALTETDALGEAERGEVLRELRSIMAVYDRPCDS